MLGSILIACVAIILLAAGVKLIVLAVQTMQNSRKARERVEYNEEIESIIREHEQEAERIKSASSPRVTTLQWNDPEEYDR